MMGHPHQRAEDKLLSRLGDIGLKWGPALIVVLGGFATFTRGWDKSNQTAELAAATSTEVSNLTIKMAVQAQINQEQKEAVCEIKQNLTEIKQDIKLLLARDRR